MQTLTNLNNVLNLLQSNAAKIGITMLGRASGKHYLAFTGHQRIVRTSPQPTELA